VSLLNTETAEYAIAGENELALCHSFAINGNSLLLSLKKLAAIAWALRGRFAQA
jgi:hypothetical protein